MRVVDENGGQIGVLSTREALQIAAEKGLDLIEVAPAGNPPVCRIMDYGKYKYARSKRDRESRKKQKTAEMRAIVIRSPRIDEHDFEVKLRILRRLLAEGDKVKINLRFRGREMSHPEFGRRVLERLAASASDVALVEKVPGVEGRMMTMVIAPRLEKHEKVEAPKAPRPPAPAAKGGDAPAA